MRSSRHFIQRNLALSLVVVLCARIDSGACVHADDEPWKKAVGGVVNALLIRQQVKQADKQYSRGNYQGALESYQAVLKLTNYADLHVRLAHCYAGLNKLSEAASEYQQALQMDNKMHGAYAGLGHIAHIQKDYARAVEQYKRAINLAPQEGAYHNKLGSLYQEQGQFAEAIPAYENAMRCAPKELLYQINLAAALCLSKQFARALSTAEGVIKLAPQHADAHKWRGLALYHSGRAPEATAALEQYLKLSPNTPTDDMARTLLGQLKGGPLPASNSGGTVPSGGAADPVTPRPALYGRPGAVLDAVARPLASPPVATVQGESIAGGAMILSRSDFWQAAARTERSLLLVAQEVQDFAVKVEWEDGGALASADQRAAARLAWLTARYAGVERLPDAPVAGVNAHRFAWVESGDTQRRESLMLEWPRERALIRLTATAPPAIWQTHAAHVFSLLEPRAASGPAAPPAIQTPTPPSVAGTVAPDPAPSTPVTPAPAASAPANAPLVVPAIISTTAPGVGEAQLQSAAIAGGALSVRYSGFWKMTDSASSYLVLSAANAPGFSVWFEWRQAEGGDTPDARAERRLERLREQHERVERVANRSVAGATATQFAWRPGGGSEKETLQVEWLTDDKTVRATVTASVPLWREHGSQIGLLLNAIRKDA